MAAPRRAVTGPQAARSARISRRSCACSPTQMKHQDPLKPDGIDPNSPVSWRNSSGVEQQVRTNDPAHLACRGAWPTMGHGASWAAGSGWEARGQMPVKLRRPARDAGRCGTHVLGRTPDGFDRQHYRGGRDRCKQLIPIPLSGCQFRHGTAPAWLWAGSCRLACIVSRFPELVGRRLLLEGVGRDGLRRPSRRRRLVGGEGLADHAGRHCRSPSGDVLGLAATRTPERRQSKARRAPPQAPRDPGKRAIPGSVSGPGRGGRWPRRVWPCA